MRHYLEVVRAGGEDEFVLGTREEVAGLALDALLGEHDDGADLEPMLRELTDYAAGRIEDLWLWTPEGSIIVGPCDSDRACGALYGRIEDAKQYDLPGMASLCAAARCTLRASEAVMSDTVRESLIDTAQGLADTAARMIRGANV